MKFYKYTNQDLLVTPEKYSYSAFQGQKLISEYINSRNSYLANLDTQNRIVVRDNDIYSIIDSGLKSLKPQPNKVRLLEYYKDLLCEHDKFTLQRKVYPVLKRFEVSKRLYSIYNNEFKAPEADYFYCAHYTILGIILSRLYQETNRLQYLSTLLKLNDTIVSHYDLPQVSPSEQRLIYSSIDGELRATLPLIAA